MSMLEQTESELFVELQPLPFPCLALTLHTGETIEYPLAAMDFK